MRQRRPSVRLEQKWPGRKAGLTLIEVLVVIGIIGILATVYFPVVGPPKTKSRMAMCMGNLRQLNRSWLQYSEDFRTELPNNPILPGTNYDTPAWVYGNLKSQTGSHDRKAIQQGQLWKYCPDLRCYQCPSAGMPTNIASITSRIRSYSMNCYMHGVDFAAKMPPVLIGDYRVNVKMSDIVWPGPSKALVFLEENENRIDDGQFGFHPDPACNTWYDAPALWHGKISNLSFADGHVELVHWKNPSTLTLNGSYTSIDAPFDDLRQLQGAIATRAGEAK